MYFLALPSPKIFNLYRELGMLRLKNRGNTLYSHKTIICIFSVYSMWFLWESRFFFSECYSTVPLMRYVLMSSFSSICQSSGSWQLQSGDTLLCVEYLRDNILLWCRCIGCTYGGIIMFQIWKISIICLRRICNEWMPLFFNFTWFHMYFSKVLSCSARVCVSDHYLCCSF